MGLKDNKGLFYFELSKQKTASQKDAVGPIISASQIIILLWILFGQEFV